MSEPRSWLFVPADSERKITKALDSEADAIIFDLEDSVAPAQKPIGPRHPQGLLEALTAVPQWWVRINPLGTDVHRDDLEMLGIADVHGIVLPKAESGADIAQLAHRTGNIPIHAIVTETPASLFGLLTYRDPKSPLAAMSWGAEDLSAALGASSKYDADRRAQLHLQAGAITLPGRRRGGRRPAGRRRLRRLPRRRRPAARSRGRARAKASPASSPSTRLRSRSSTPPLRPSAEDVLRTPRRSSPRSKHIPTQACCRSTAKWSTARTLCRRRRVLERAR